MTEDRTLNVNVGVLGHVDSGKTSLVATLSTHFSTAALDKHPQSRDRGITIDLGFSSFTVDAPAHYQQNVSKVQYTLVDCPGHASLIRTIIGGASIIDMMLLVIDATKGIQTQTAECLVVGEITTSTVVVVLNKIDLIPDNERETKLSKLEVGLRKVLQTTRFQTVRVVRVSARPGGMDNRQGFSAEGAIGIDELIGVLKEATPQISRSTDGPFLHAIDHCFAIKGQGTICTGTVISGSVKVGDSVQDAMRTGSYKVKSMQKFKKPVSVAQTGDRVGICVVGLDPSQIERGLLCAPGSVPLVSGAIASIRRVRHFRQDIKSKSRFNVCIGHQTVMAEIILFSSSRNTDEPAWIPRRKLSEGESYEYEETLTDDSSKEYWALLTFVQPVVAPIDSILIGAKFDIDTSSKACRIAFFGSVISACAPNEFDKVSIFKWKERMGTVERVERDGRTAICTGLFKKESDISIFLNMFVESSTGNGKLTSSFGKSGKCKVEFHNIINEGETIRLRFKKNVSSGKSSTKAVYQ